MRRKGRTVPPVQPGERRQYAPGRLINSLNPGVRHNIELLAVAGYERDGRGLLIVEISDEVTTGIVSAQYLGMTQITAMNRRIPFADAQPASEAIKHYDPEREFVALVMDVTPSLPNPQTWFDVFPREGSDKAPKQKQTRTIKARGRKALPTPKQEAAMATAYALIEDMARAGYAEKGRGFVFNAIYPDGTKPYFDYLTLDADPGRGLSN